MKQQNGQDRRIVVGVDGSRESTAALRWAIRQAELTGSSVEAVIAWHYPVIAGAYAWAPPLPANVVTDFADVAGKQLSEALAEVIDPASIVHVTPRVVQGNATQVLLDVAAGAELLVVGSRGHGGFAGALLGSVSQHCSHHAPCPLVIVHGQSTAAEETALQTQGPRR